MVIEFAKQARMALAAYIAVLRSQGSSERDIHHCVRHQVEGAFLEVKPKESRLPCVWIATESMSELDAVINRAGPVIGCPPMKEDD